MLEVAHRELEAAAAFGLDQLAQGLDAPLGVARDDVLARNQQIGVGLLARAPDPAAQLIELGQAEMIGAVDDHRVGVGDIEARLDNRRADQHVDAILDELAHHVLELMLLHLAVRDRDFRLGHDRAQMARHVVDILDPVVDEKHLARAVELAHDHVANQGRRRNARRRSAPPGGPAAAVWITLKSRIPSIAMCSVRGIGVAVMVRTSTSLRRRLMRSLSATPKRCSSSMISRPSLGNSTSSWSRRWVPMTISTSPLPHVLDHLPCSRARCESARPFRCAPDSP